MMFAILLLGAFLTVNGQNYNQPNCEDGRTVIVHLFNWKWTDIAKECEGFLGPKGFCGVQVSPPNEHRIVGGRPWWERYQPVSYKLDSRSGSHAEFRDMVTRCNAVGVKTYVDAIINHMTGVDAGTGIGTGGSDYNTGRLTFSGVPYGPDDFNCCNGQSCPGETCFSGSCNIESYGDSNQVRNCRLVGLLDLAVSTEYVRGKIAEYFNNLMEIGVAGFRVDACKHMWPGDLENIYSRLYQTPFIFNEVIDLGGEPIGAGEYTHLGRVTEFKYGARIGRIFRYGRLAELESWPPGDFLPDADSFVFVDNHDNQRGHGAGGSDILTFQVPNLYKPATAFTLAHPYGFTRIMSSYDYKGDTDAGPPSSGEIIDDVVINADGTCEGTWMCEHRWRQITNMVTFRNVADGTSVQNWWSNGNNQVAFSRGNKAFLALNREGYEMNENLATGLPEGTYCDVISGDLENGACTGSSVYVAANGRADIIVPVDDQIADIDGMLAFHEQSRVGSGGGTPSPTGVPPTPGPSTTSGPTTPPAEGYHRTVVFLKQQTSVGQSVFLRGGISHDVRPGCTDSADSSPCALPIITNSLGTTEHYAGYNAWRQGDKHLDWYGAEPGQGTYNNQRADGSPSAWTSSNPTNPGFQSLNKYGDHYWMLDIEMLCDETEAGWFEVKGFTLNGGGWEADIHQGSCTGDVGGTAPYRTGNHMARCGQVNVFSWNSGECQINEF